MKTDRHVLVVGSDAELIGAVGGAIRGLRNLSLEIARSEGVRSLSGKTNTAAAVIIEVDAASPDGIDRFQRLAFSARERQVLAAARGATGEQVRHLFRAGAADVLTGPFTGDIVRASLREVMETGPALGAMNGGVISIVKGCGGAGATTVALNLAALFAQGDAKRGRPARSAAVLDLDLQFGDAALALDLTPRSTIVDVLRAQERVDARFVESVMTEHASGLKLLAAPSSVVPLDAISGDFAVDLIEHATATFERTIIDLPASWTDWTFPVLQRSDVVVLVTTPTVPGALGARRVLDALGEAGVQRPVFLVLNKLAGVIDAFEKPGRIGKSLEMGVDAALSFDPIALKAADRGQLVVDAFANSKLAKDFRPAAAKLDGRLESLSAGLAFTEIAA
jgi:pilus assembly protein CpaE